MADTIPGNTSSFQILSVDTSASSAIDFAGDTDWWRVSLVGGYGYRVWVEGSQHFNGSLVNPYLAVYNNVGTLQLQNNDRGLGELDAYLYVIPGTGTYFLSAEAWGNATTGTYTITLQRDTLDSTSSAASVSVNAEVSDRINWVGDIDWTAVTLTAGVTYQFDMVGSVADGQSGAFTLVDPWLALRNAVGTLQAADDDSGVGANARITFTPLLSGTYFLDAQEGGINDIGSYRLIVNSFPVAGAITIGTPTTGSVDFAGDTDEYSVFLTAGTTYTITLTGSTLIDPFLEVLDSSKAVVSYLDDNGLSLDPSLAFTPSSSGTYYLAARASGNTGTGSYSLNITSDAIPSNTSSLQTLAIGTSATSSIDFAGDADWWRMTMLPGYGYQIWVEGSQHAFGTLADPLLTVYSSAGGFLGSNDNRGLGEFDAYLNFFPALGGTFFISAEESGNNATGTYTITAWRDALASAASLTSVAVGGSYSERLGWSGDVSDWVAVTLSAGVEYQFDMVGDTVTGLTLTNPWLVLRNSAGLSLRTDNDSGVDTNARIAYIPSVSGTYFLDAQAFDTTTQGTYKLIVNSGPVVGAIALGVPATGSINFPEDTDQFTVSLTAGVTYTITLGGLGGLNPSLEVLSATGAVIDIDDDSGPGSDAALTFTATSSGTHYLAARSSGYASTGDYTLSITSDSIPGNSSSLQSLVLGTSSTSSIDFNGDTDWWRVTLTPGYGYQLWLEGSASGHGTLVDPYLRVYNSVGVQQAANDDLSLSSLDSYINLNSNTGGIVFLSAEESGNNATGSYTLTAWRDALATTASATTVSINNSYSERVGWQGDSSDWIKLTLSAGVTYQFDLLGSTADGAAAGLSLADPWLALRGSNGLVLLSNNDFGLGANARITYTAAVSGTYFLDAQEYGVDASGVYRVLVNSSPVAGAIALGAPVAGSTDFAGDVDQYSISLVGGVTYNVILNGGTLTDPFLELLDVDGAVLDSDDDSGPGLNALLSFTPSTSGIYYLAARASGQTATGSYSLSITGTAPTVPSLSIAASNADRAEGHSGSTAFTFSVTRGDVTSGTTTVNWTVSASGAGPLADASDFGGTLPFGSLSFAPGETSKTITVNVSGDTAYESGGVAENFTVQLSSPSGGATLAAASALGHIQNDDAQAADDYSAGPSTVGVVLVGSQAAGTIETVGDADWFKVTLAANTTYTFAATGIGTHNLRDPFLTLYAADTTELSDNDDGLPGFNSIFSYTTGVSGAGTYYLGVRSNANALDVDVGSYGVSATAGTKGNFDAAMGAGVIDTDSAWNTSPGAAVVVTYGYRSTPAPYNFDDNNAATHDSDITSFTRLSALQIATIEQILQLWSDVANISFQRINPAGYTDSATMLIGNYADAFDGAGAFASYPGSTASTAKAGDIWLNLANGISATSNPVGAYGFSTIAHEVGHALGLSHPGSYNAAPGLAIAYAADAQFLQDTGQFSIMTYFDQETSGGADFLGSLEYTPMLFDVLAMQNIYGVNTGTRTGNTVYGFGSTAGSIYDFAANPQPVLTIWDAGGSDTLNSSGFANNQRIDLRAGSFSNIGALTLNVAIALGATIENAVGGTGVDTVIGNDVANVLTGNAGNDSLQGGLGDDTLVGGTGNDSLTGEGGIDTASYSGVRSAYVVTAIGGGFTISSVAEGTDTLIGVEAAQFSDQTISLGANVAPASSHGSASLSEDAALNASLPAASDANGDPITYAKASDPAHGNLTVASNGSYAYTPVANYFGGDSFTFTVSDGQGGSNTYTQTLTVTAVNDAPVLGLPIPDQAGTAGAAFGYTVSAGAFSDVDNASLSYSATLESGAALPAWLSFNAATRAFSGTPAADNVGAINVKVTASDGSLAVNDVFVLTIAAAPNLAPVASNGSASSSEDSVLNASLPAASDANGDPIGYAKASDPAHGNLTVASNGSYAYTPVANYFGGDSFTFTVSDGQGGSNTYTQTLTVTAVNDAPVVALPLPDLAGTTGSAFAYSVLGNAFSDVDNISLSYSATLDSGAALPAWLSFNTAARAFSGTPSAANLGSLNIKVTASDGSLSAFDVFALTISVPANRAPTASHGSANVAEEASISGNLPVATDLDGDTITYARTSSPAHGNLTLGSSGAYSYTPVANYSGADTFSFIVSDGKGGSNSYSFNLNVTPVVDTINGSAGNDNLVGYADADVINGKGGSNSLTGLGGNDTLLGGAGIDTAIYSVPKSAASYVAAGLGWSVTTPADGTDTLFSIERLTFTDTSVALDIHGSAGGTARIIGAIFGTQFLSNKDFVGIGIQLLDGGMPFADLVALATSIDLFKSLAGSSNGVVSNMQFVNLIYQNITGAAPSTTELATYVGLLDRGDYTQSALAVLACNSEVNAQHIDLVGLSHTGIEFVPQPGG